MAATKAYPDICGAVLVPNPREHLPTLLDFVGRFRGTMAEVGVYSTRGAEYFSTEIAAVRAALGDQGTDCTFALEYVLGLLFFQFLENDQLVVAWSTRDISLAEAVEKIVDLATELHGSHAYVAEGPWLPADREEFFVGYSGRVLFRAGPEGSWCDPSG